MRPPHASLDHPGRPLKEARGGLGWVVGLAAIICFAGLGALPLVSFTEGRYGSIAAEMLATGDYVTPRFAGIKHFEKPPLVYWWSAAHLALGGLGEGQARLPSAISGFVVVLLTWWIARRWRGERVAMVAALILVTMPLFLALARTILTDVVLAMGSTLYVAATLAGARARQSAWRAAVLAGVGLAIALLAKLTIVFLVGVLPLIVTAIWHRDRKLAWATLHPLAWLIAAGSLAPWAWVVHTDNPGIATWVWEYQVLGRVLTEEHHREGPVWFYLAVLPWAIAPWILAVPLLWRRRGTHAPEPTSAFCTRRFLWLWFVLPLVVFSLSGSKRENYLPPILPPLAMLLAEAISAGWPAARDRKTSKSRLPADLTRWVIGYAVFVALAVPTATYVLRAQGDRFNTMRDVAIAVRPHAEAGVPIVLYHLEAGSVPFYLGGKPCVLVGVERVTLFETPRVLAERTFSEADETQKARFDAWVARAREAVFLTKRGDRAAHLVARFPDRLVLIHEGPRYVAYRLRR